MADETILNAAELAAIRARAEQARPGPWEEAGGRFVTRGPQQDRVCTTEGLPGDTAFIAHAREDISRLLTTVATYHEIVAMLAYFPDYGDADWCGVLRARAQALLESPAPPQA